MYKFLIEIKREHQHQENKKLFELKLLHIDPFSMSKF